MPISYIMTTRGTAKGNGEMVGDHQGSTIGAEQAFYRRFLIFVFLFFKTIQTFLLSLSALPHAARAGKDKYHEIAEQSPFPFSPLLF